MRQIATCRSPSSLCDDTVLDTDIVGLVVPPDLNVWIIRRRVFYFFSISFAAACKRMLSSSIHSSLT